MREILLGHLEVQRATNAHRQQLLSMLKEELAAWSEHLEEMQLWLFGSFLTEKEIPTDIDVICAGKTKPRASWPLRLPREHQQHINVKSLFKPHYVPTIEQLIEKFNENEGNLKNNIRLTADQVVRLVL